MITTTPFQITVNCVDDQWTLGVIGSLDLATGQELIELGRVLGEGRPGLVLLDLSELDFVDTSGLHALARTAALVRAGGGATSIVGTSSRALTRLLDALDGCGLSTDLTDPSLTRE